MSIQMNSSCSAGITLRGRWSAHSASPHADPPPGLPKDMKKIGLEIRGTDDSVNRLVSLILIRSSSVLFRLYC